MYEKISIAKMSREEWLKLRKTGIGGSDAGAICGLNPYSSPMKIFREKTSEEIELLDNERLRQGSDLEQYVADRFCEATGLKVRRSNYMYRSRKYPWMIADVDRFIVGEDAGLECKTVSAYQADKWKDGAIPLHYVMQCYHYMAVTGRKTFYLCALILGQDLLIHKLIWDDALINDLIKLEWDFWTNHVMTGVMPEPDGSDSYDEMLTKYFPTAKNASAIDLIGFDEKLDRHKQLGEQITMLEQEQNRIEQEVKLFMEDHELAASDKYRVSWSNVDTVRLDTKRIRQEQPQIYKAFSKVSSSRRFQIKAA